MCCCYYILLNPLACPPVSASRPSSIFDPLMRPCKLMRTMYSRGKASISRGSTAQPPPAEEMPRDAGGSGQGMDAVGVRGGVGEEIPPMEA